MAIVLADLLDVRNVELDLRPGSVEDVCRQLVDLLAGNGQLTATEAFLNKVLERERANPSLIEHGVAFPHARTDLVPQIVLAIGRSRAGIPFVENGPRAHLIFLIGVPQRLVSDYLICVGALARLAKNQETRTRLLNATTREEMIVILSAPA